MGCTVHAETHDGGAGGMKFDISVNTIEEKKEVMDVMMNNFSITEYKSRSIMAKHPKAGEKRFIRLWIHATKLPKKH